MLEDRKPALRKLQIESAVKSGDSFKLNRALRAGLRYAKQLDEAPLDDERTFARGFIFLIQSGVGMIAYTEISAIIISLKKLIFGYHLSSYQ